MQGTVFGVKRQVWKMAESGLRASAKAKEAGQCPASVTCRGISQPVDLPSLVLIRGSLNRRRSGVALLLAAFPDGNRTGQQSPHAEQTGGGRFRDNVVLRENIRPGVVIEIGNLRVALTW